MDYENPVIKKAKFIAKRNTAADLDQAQQILLHYLINNPQHTSAWLLLMCIEWNPPHEDFVKIKNWANTILEYDPKNAYALLFLAETFFMNETIYDKLLRAKSDNLDTKAMIEVAKAKYLEDKPDRLIAYESILQNAIQLAPHQALHYRMLGQHYIKQGRTEEGESLICRSEENEQKANVLYEQEEYDPTSLNAFLNQWYTGL